MQNSFHSYSSTFTFKKKNACILWYITPGTSHNIYIKLFVFTHAHILAYNVDCFGLLTADNLFLLLQM